MRQLSLLPEWVVDLRRGGGYQCGPEPGVVLILLVVQAETRAEARLAVLRRHPGALSVKVRRLYDDAES